MSSTDYTYLTMVNDILHTGKTKANRTGVDTLSIFEHDIKLNASSVFPMVTAKKVNFKAVAHELIWFIKGDMNIKYLVDNNVKIWNLNAYDYYKKIMENSFIASLNGILSFESFISTIKDKNKDDLPVYSNGNIKYRLGDLGNVYGKQWRNWNGVDQLQNAVDTLKNNPNSRRILVNSWNVSELNNMALPPCHVMFEFYSEDLTEDERKEIAVHEKYIQFKKSGVDWLKVDTDEITYDHIPTKGLSLKWSQRSCDVFLGIPFNLSSYALLLNIVAKLTNHHPVTLKGSLTNVHIYKNHIDQCHQMLENPLYSAPTLKIDNLKSLEEISIENFTLVDYKSNKYIKGNMAV